MTLARLTSFALLFLLASLASLPSSASKLGNSAATARILIADPSPALHAYLSASGFAVEAVERLRAFDLTLMVVVPPERVPPAAALHHVRERFPGAIAALDDRIELAGDAKAARPTAVQPRQITNAIGWPAGGYPVASGLRIGVIDSTLDDSHPALRGAAIVQRRFTSGTDPAADTAHGTAIAAMLVGRSDDTSVSGLLRGATLYYANIFRTGKDGSVAGSADFLRAVDWLIESDVTVINASITSRSENPVVKYAMSLLSHEKIILVAAAGNGGPSGPPVYPAAIPSAFAVTAVSIDGKVYDDANKGDYIDIAAPGIDLPTTSRKITSGTSLAVPFVTAAVAHMIHICNVPPADAEARLEAGARDLGPNGWDPSFGWGLLQAMPGCGNQAHGDTARPLASRASAVVAPRDDFSER